MTLIKTRFPKMVLALTLAVILALSLVPMMTYQASAAVYYAATGVVTDAGMSTITILSGGKYRHFSKEDAKIVDPFKKGLALGDTVKVVFNSKHPQVALQINIVAHKKGDRVEHQPDIQLVISGTVRTIGMSTIGISVNGKRFNFSQEDAHIAGAPDDGIMVGDQVRITYHKNNPGYATQILFMKAGPNHDNADDYQWSGTDTVANRSFTGWIPDMDGNSVVVQDLKTGNSLRFFYDWTNDDMPEIAIGDVIKVLYNDKNAGFALRIVMVDEGTNH